MQDEFVQPDGERLIIEKSGKDTNGELLAMKATYNPNSELPPMHYHPYQEEQFEVLGGRFRTLIADKETIYEAGDRFVVPANTPHGMQNVGDEEGQLLWQVRPARNTEDLLRTLWGLGAEGKTGPDGVPNLLQLAVMFQAYSNEIRLAKPPFLVQRLLFGLLAPVGKLLGYRARYPRYSGKSESAQQPGEEER